MVRLDKLLVQSGRCSRSEARTLTRSGRVTVDGAVVRSPEVKVEEGAEVRIDGEAVNC